MIRSWQLGCAWHRLDSGLGEAYDLPQCGIRDSEVKMPPKVAKITKDGQYRVVLPKAVKVLTPKPKEARYEPSKDTKITVRKG